MAPSKRKGKPPIDDNSVPLPPGFKRASDIIYEHFTDNLSKEHVYLTHIDQKPRDFKRKIFLVPVSMNIAVALLFVWRVYYILPYYLNMLGSALGHHNEIMFDVAGSTWPEVGWEIGRRGFSFMLDLVLFVFVWPWPVEFCLGRRHGNPVRWRWNVGFRDREIYVRRSRDWTRTLGDGFLHAAGKRNVLLSMIQQATAPTFLQEKTGYLTMNAAWELDWDLMVRATKLVDDKQVASDAFRCLALVHDAYLGWICVDFGSADNAKEDERRRQVFAFRDALAAVDKEDLFFRWIEIVQFESTRPEGFGPERQAEAAQRIREMFEKEGINFDELWKESVGTDSLAGM